MHKLTPFCTQTNLRENRFFAGEGQLVDKKAAFVLKFMPKNGQNRLGSWREVWLTS